MPAGSFQSSPNSEHAGFQLSKAGNKMLLIVALDHSKGHVQTDILLIKRTSKQLDAGNVAAITSFTHAFVKQTLCGALHARVDESISGRL